ncbi:MAG: efflux RND transporter periplasmic adaptor subunit [Chlamydiales bacterium]|nr:efflux RND transporter periplasmic adaptor subunit [Chlamydiales bacterium]NCF70571.1 efflux RND transporter periplasmic adaptor subunit [Chlamydiales bacterium]
MKTKVLFPSFLLFTFVFNSLFSAEANEEKPITVKIAYPKKQELEDFISFPAKLKPAKELIIKSEVEGILSYSNLKEGEKVSKSASIFHVINHANLQDFNIRQANYYRSKLKFNNTKELFQKKAASLNQLKEAQSNLSIEQALLEKSRMLVQQGNIQAPFDGFLEEFSLEPGSFITKGQQLTRIINHENVYALFYIFENHLNKVELNKAVSFTPLSYPEKSFQGKVSFIDKQVSELGSRILVKAQINNQDLSLLPNMSGDLKLILGETKTALLIPEDALVPSEDSTFFYYIKDSQAKKFYPTLGRSLNKWVEVTNWEETDTAIIIEGQFKIWEEDQKVLIFDQSQEDNSKEE